MNFNDFQKQDFMFDIQELQKAVQGARQVKLFLLSLQRNHFCDRPSVTKKGPRHRVTLAVNIGSERRPR